MCKACKKTYNAAYYEVTKDRHNPGRIARRKRAQQEAREMVYQYLSEHPWVDCGESDVVVLDFDHQGDKMATINTLIKRGAAISTILTEMAKCEVVCSNDHRRRTAKAQPWRRVDVESGTSLDQRVDRGHLVALWSKSRTTTSDSPQSTHGCSLKY